MNKTFVIGRLTADPTQTNVNGKMCTNFSLASDTRKKPDGTHGTNFYRCGVWGVMGENCMKYLHKGDQIFMEGEQEFQTYTGTDGQQRFSVDVFVNDVKFLNTKRQDGETNTTPAPVTPAPAAPVMDTGDELPF